MSVWKHEWKQKSITRSNRKFVFFSELCRSVSSRRKQHRYQRRDQQVLPQPAEFDKRVSDATQIAGCIMYNFAIFKIALYNFASKAGVDFFQEGSTHNSAFRFVR